jgi:hypothetical protein
MRAPLLIANCSGFYGDRLSAAEEMVEGGPIHVLTGDYLAELTMAILAKARGRDATRGGYVPTFLRQTERVLATCMQRGIKIVTNAGGLAPRALADDLGALAKRLGLSPRIAWIEGDDLAPRMAELIEKGEVFSHLDRRTPLSAEKRAVVAANAYLGGFGIKLALDRGADIVVCPRVTDASLVVGPAAHHFGWTPSDLDALAGAVAAGHVIECGTQATGGNYSFPEEVPSFERVGFPLVELSADGSFVVTKHPGTGGIVSVGTVTAQLLYEIGGPRYVNPDVVARFDTLALTEEGPDRVRVTGARGEAPPPAAKVSILLEGGFKNSMTLLVPGPDARKKADAFTAQLFSTLGGKERFTDAKIDLLLAGREGAPTRAESVSLLRIAVSSPDPKLAGRTFSSAIVELLLSSMPGLSATAPPSDAMPYTVYFPALVDRRHLVERVHIGGEMLEVAEHAPFVGTLPPLSTSVFSATVTPPSGALLGTLFGARSGDTGGNANLGVWVRSPGDFALLAGWLDEARLRELLPEITPFPLERHVFPNLLAVNFVIRGILGDGPSSSLSLDPQAKTLAEVLRSRVFPLGRVERVDLPQRSRRFTPRTWSASRRAASPPPRWDRSRAQWRRGSARPPRGDRRSRRPGGPGSRGRAPPSGSLDRQDACGSHRNVLPALRLRGPSRCA